MTNPKEPIEKVSAQTEEQVSTPLEGAGEQIKEAVVKAEEKATSPLDEVMSQAERA